MSREELKQKYFPLLPESTVIPLSVSTILDMLMVVSNKKKCEILDSELDVEIVEAFRKRKFRNNWIAFGMLREYNVVTLRDILEIGREELLRWRHIGNTFATQLQTIFQELGYDF